VRVVILAALAVAAAGCGSGGGAGGGSGGNAAAGKGIFVSAGCSRCHQLAADASGRTLRPTFEQAVARVTNGKSPMPSFRNTLSREEIRDVAAYVVASEPLGLIRVR
jgi:mono/diheme cytochrome c family protein